MNDYEIRARIIPSIIITLPLIVPVYLLVSAKFQPIFTAVFFGILFISVIYTMSFFVRNKGKKIQKQLYVEWGGMPSVCVIRWEDQTFDEDFKRDLHNEIKNYCGINLSSLEEEKKDPKNADRLIENAFNQVKSLVYFDYPNGTWKIYNAEYGFNRNLMSCKYYWIIFAIIGLVACSVRYHYTKELIYSYGAILDGIFLILAICWSFYVLPHSIKIPADYYARDIWNSFLIIMRKSKDLRK